jgi:signal transduction histidine kinase/CheY-like chemotaxis protein
MLRFRTKLLLLVGVAGFALVLLIALDAITGHVEEEELQRIEASYLPLLELGPRVNAQMERLRRAFQDAAAALDDGQLAEAERARNELQATLRRARGVLPRAEVSLLELRVDRYFEAAMLVTRGMIAGEPSTSMVDAITTMQQHQKEAAESLARATSFDRKRLEHAFSSLRNMRDHATRTRIAVASVCLLLVLLLSTWIGRRTLRSLEELSSGFARFGNNELTTPIRVLSTDEVGEVAERANRMAERLHELMRQHEQNAWLATGQAELSRAIEGVLSADEVAQRALTFLTRYLSAPVAAIYEVSEGVPGTCLASHGVAAEHEGGGLLAVASEKNELMRLDDLPEDYLRVASGLGSARPRSVWIVPIAHLGSAIAILELAFLREAPPGAFELLELSRHTLGVALHVAFTTAAKQALLHESQELTRRLTVQEEELRAINEELEAQQEELRAANEELLEQADTLEDQRRVLSERNEALEAARARLQHQTIELESASRYKSQFLANMSHELRTPLNSMLLLSDLLSRNEQENLSEKQVEYASTIHAAGQDLLRLINQVLDLAKIEAGKLDVRPAALSVRDLLVHMRRVYEPLANQKGLELRMDVADGVPDTIVSDRARIEQVLTNLIGNAIKFTEHGTVRVSVSRSERSDRPAMLEFKVRDSGVGIAEHNLARIFEAFEQVDGGSQRKHGGTGLGLSIARQLAHLLGGELTAASKLGQGSTFVLRITTALRAGSDSTLAQAEQAGAGRLAGEHPSHASPLSPERGALLIIEDDLMFAERVATLAHERGLTALIAKDGATGLGLARAHKPRGVVLDVRLPDMDGFSLHDRLRALPECQNIPVHFVSCVDRGPGQALGAVGYLRKPASREDLISVFERLAPSAPRRVLVVEDDSQLGSSLVKLLSEQGLSAICVRTGGEGLEALRGQSFACMILDLGLPDIDGLELLVRMENDASLPKVPVIVYTGRALNRAEARRLEAYTAGIVLKDEGSVARLLDEVRLFVEQLERRAPVGEDAQPSPQDNLEGKKVLVADDDMRTAYALSALLRDRGVDVLVAENGRAAVNMLANDNGVDAVIMDVMMPEMDGYEAMREIRKDARYQSLPIIALTAKAMKDDRVRCLEAGASEYMTKPIDGDRLLSVLHAWLATG